MSHQRSFWKVGKKAFAIWVALCLAMTMFTSTVVPYLAFASDTKLNAAPLTLSPQESETVSNGERIGVGDIIQFGEYEQDGNPDNGAEPIDWKVLSIDGDEALVLSVKGLEKTSRYSGEWLESVFYEDAFNGYEKQQIVEQLPPGSAWTSGSEPPYVHVFRLYYNDAATLLSEDGSFDIGSSSFRTCEVTEHVKAYLTYEGGVGWWPIGPWISPGGASYYGWVDTDGSISTAKYDAFNTLSDQLCASRQVHSCSELTTTALGTIPIPFSLTKRRKCTASMLFT